MDSDNPYAAARKLLSEFVATPDRAGAVVSSAEEAAAKEFFGNQAGVIFFDELNHEQDQPPREHHVNDRDFELSARSAARASRKVANRQRYIRMMLRRDPSYRCGGY